MLNRKLNQEPSKTKFKFLNPQQVVDYKIYQCPRVDVTPIMQFDVWNNICQQQIDTIQNTLSDSPEHLFKYIYQIKESEMSFIENKKKKKRNLFIPIKQFRIRKVKKETADNNKSIKWFR